MSVVEQDLNLNKGEDAHLLTPFAKRGSKRGAWAKVCRTHPATSSSPNQTAHFPTAWHCNSWISSFYLMIDDQSLPYLSHLLVMLLELLNLLSRFVFRGISQSFN